MRVKFQQNRKVQSQTIGPTNLSFLTKKWLTIFDEVLTEFYVLDWPLLKKYEYF